MPVSVVVLHYSAGEEKNALEHEGRARMPRHPGHGEVRTQHSLSLHTTCSMVAAMKPVIIYIKLNHKQICQ